MCPNLNKGGKMAFQVNYPRTNITLNLGDITIELSLEKDNVCVNAKHNLNPIPVTDKTQSKPVTVKNQSKIENPKIERLSDIPIEMVNFMKEKLDRHVDELDLSVRSANCFANAGINYIGELVQFTEVEILKIKNFGRKQYLEIKELLAEMKLCFGINLKGVWEPPK